MTDPVVWSAQQVTVRELQMTNLEGLWSLTLDLETSDSAARRTRIVCIAVRSLKLPNWPPSGGQLSALAVYEVSTRPLEGIRYSLVDYEDGQIEVECLEVNVDR